MYVDSMELLLVKKAAEDALFSLRNSSASSDGQPLPMSGSVTYPIQSGNDSLAVKVSLNEPDRDTEFARMIESNCHSGDTELDHINADDLLVQLLHRLGFQKTLAAYAKVHKYFA